jgi:hypothetical protein
VITANQVRANRVKLTGKGTAGSIKLRPTSGPPGTVTVVTGTGFAANTTITLAWSVGLTSNLPGTISTDSKGSFTAQMLVLPHDVLGPRQLKATPLLVTGAGTPSTAKFTVYMATGVPPLFGIQVFRDPFGRVIVLRR